MRAIPLTEGGNRVGALLLLRDVSELRRRELELLTKDATIREIHHRVKNNLQTVAALLRLQARRLPVGEAGRVALEEAVRRVGVIALVHETLSQGFDETVDFDDIAVRGLQAITEVAKVEHPITSGVQGSFGTLRAEDATALAMVVSELVQNAVEHGLADTGAAGSTWRPSAAPTTAATSCSPSRSPTTAPVCRRVFGRATSGLGTQIVQSLIQDLRGRIVWESAKPRGTRVRFHRAASATGQGLVLTSLARPLELGSRRRVSGGWVAEDQPARRARALRRLRARRSSSDIPPQTPASWPDSMAHLRHMSITGQRRQTALASSICRMAGPVFPMGKNSSGSSSRQAARSRQSMKIVLLAVTGVRVRVGVVPGCGPHGTDASLRGCAGSCT